MAKLFNQEQKGIKIYDMITDLAEKKLMMLTHKLGIDKFAFEARNHWDFTFYDTPDNLLTKTGILLYRTTENNENYFKMEKLSFLPSVSRIRKTELFMLKVARGDTPKHQAFYLINGITEMFSTHFYIDLENVIKAVVPKMHIDIVGKAYKGVRGDGFKCLVEFQKVTYKNLVTKKKFKNSELTVTQNCSQNFDSSFEEFLITLERYCKDILPQKTTRYDLGMRMTQISEKPTITKEDKKKAKAEKKKKKAKTVRIEDKIEG